MSLDALNLLPFRLAWLFSCLSIIVIIVYRWHRLFHSTVKLSENRPKAGINGSIFPTSKHYFDNMKYCTQSMFLSLRLISPNTFWIWRRWFCLQAQGGVCELFRPHYFHVWSDSYKQQRNRKYRYRAFQKVQRKILTPSELGERVDYFFERGVFQWISLVFPIGTL